MKAFFCEISILQRVCIDLHQKSWRNLVTDVTESSSVTATPCGLCTDFQWGCCYSWWFPTRYNTKAHLRRQKVAATVLLIQVESPCSFKLPPAHLEGSASSFGLSLPSAQQVKSRTNRWWTGKWPMNWQTVAECVCHFYRPIFCTPLLLQYQKPTGTMQATQEKDTFTQPCTCTDYKNHKWYLMNACLCCSDEAHIYFAQLTDRSTSVPLHCHD